MVSSIRPAMSEAATYRKGAKGLVLLLSEPSFFPWFSGTELPTNGIGMAHEPFNDSAPQPIDVLHRTELLWAETDNFPRLETTMKQQICQALFSLVGQQAPDYLPELLALTAVFCPCFT